MIKFKIKAREFDQFFTVIIYDKLEEMRAAANKFSRQTGADEDNNEAYGVCHTFIRMKIGSDGSSKENPWSGIIRLAKPHLGNEVFSHELAHAALHIYRLDNKGKANFGTGIDDREEQFCAIYGRLYRDFINKSYKYNIWK